MWARKRAARAGAFEAHLYKTRDLKPAMMQELLTGRIRLISSPVDRTLQGGH